MDEPANLQMQMYEILTNKELYAVLLDTEERKFMHMVMSSRPDILDSINEVTSEYFVNGNILSHNIPSLVLKIFNVYNHHYDISSRLFLSNITRFTIDCILNYKVYNMHVYDMTNIEKAIDSSVRILLVDNRKVPSGSSPSGNIFGWLFNFCS